MMNLRIERWEGPNKGKYIVMTNNDNGMHLSFSALDWEQIKQSIERLIKPTLQ